MARCDRSLLVTGAGGLVGGEALRRLLAGDARLHAHVLVRDPHRWARAARRPGLPLKRVTPVAGDVTLPGLGLAAPVRRALEGRVDAVLHAAADTVFSRPLSEARRVNRDGTAHALELASRWRVARFAYVSTAFVAGRMRGRVPARAHDGAAGWVNAYERSKHEAEALVREAGVPWVILRPSTVVCETEGGEVRQVNAVHRALHLHHQGLASLLPGEEDTPVDLVTNAYVGAAVAALALAPDAEGRTYHLCAGAGALPLGELLDVSHAVWSECEAWRRRGVVRPALTDAETYRLFEQAVEETGDARLRRITRSLSHFVPQLALAKTFDTAGTDAALGFAAPPVRSYWRAMLRHLLQRRWSPATRRAA